MRVKQLTCIKVQFAILVDKRGRALFGPSQKRNDDMANTLTARKIMTIGEGGSALAFAALALLSIVVAAKAFTPEFAFHAYLFTAASIAAVFAIINRYYERPVEMPR